MVSNFPNLTKNIKTKMLKAQLTRKVLKETITTTTNSTVKCQKPITENFKRRQRINTLCTQEEDKRRVGIL